MTSTFDVGVVGGGTMGTAAAFFLARSGLRVILFEQFGIVHEFGSHSGATRIIRHAYHESPDYVPLVLRADQLWQDLQQISGQQLLVRTGGIDLGPRDGNVVDHALLACRDHSLPHEYLDATEIMEQWPQFRIPENWHGCYDPNMGFLLVDGCIRAYADAARDAGCVIHEEEPVEGFSQDMPIRLRTAKSEYELQKLVVCGGAWNSKLLADLNLPLIAKRKALVWLTAEREEEFQPGRFPVFLADTSAGLLYGFPIYGKPGLKIANHHGAGPAVDPDQVDRTFRPGDATDAQIFSSQHLKGVKQEVLDGKICLYTMTPDEHFILDLHPANDNIAIAAGFSGHGFKFAPVIGEILRELIVHKRTHHPISKFSLTRFNTETRSHRD